MTMLKHVGMDNEKIEMKLWKLKFRLAAMENYVCGMSWTFKFIFIGDSWMKIRNFYLIMI